MGIENLEEDDEGLKENGRSEDKFCQLHILVLSLALRPC